MKNNNNNQNNYNLILKPINSFSLKEDNSYINSALQCLIHLDCINKWIKLLNNYKVMNNFEACITKEFYQLFICLYSNQEKIDSTNLIFHFKNKMNSLYNKDIKKDPYHFLFYFLELLHCENNSPVNINYDINKYKKDIKNIGNQQNDNIMFNLYCNYFVQTQNSVISDYFFNTEKYTYKCNNCSKSIYYYDYVKIFNFNLDKFKKYRAQQNNFNLRKYINLDECFYYYEIENNIKCDKCKNHNAFNNRKIYTSTNVVLISFKRETHKYKGDVFFKLNFSLCDYVLVKNINNKNYFLKAIISGYYYNKSMKYFVDICINNNWYRFLDNAFKKIKNINELYTYEPQILIYEIYDSQSDDANFINPFYKRINNVNNDKFFIPTQAKLNQMRIEQMKKMHDMQIMNMMQIIKQNFMFMQLDNQINNNNNNNINNNSPYIFLQFLIIPEIWDGSQENSLIIKPQVMPEDTIETAIKNFFVKLQKPKEAITKFLFNNNQIFPNSQIKLKDYGINNDSIIYAIKSYNFDELRLV
jgi:ubiquitin C-terminal hydrolase